MVELRQRKKVDGDVVRQDNLEDTSKTAPKPAAKGGLSSFWIRFFSTWAMIGGFLLTVYLGHLPLVGLVIVLQSLMFREVVNLGTNVAEEEGLPGFRGLYWLWFTTALVFMYGRMLIWSFGVKIPMHSFISFSLYCAGMVAFVVSLRKGSYRYQFTAFAWCHVALLIVVMQSAFLVLNMFQGLIWFILPACLIVSNDIWAYMWGKSFGRTQLIQISPNKTWEGFLGAFITTVLSAYYFASFFSQFESFICPKEDLTFAAVSCEPSYVFVQAPHALPPWLSALLAGVSVDVTEVMVAPIQLHAMLFAVFASIIAPFGGFFASGFKRAFEIKDFGDSIPGHGGVTDRMDCQIMMGLFVFVYYWTFIASSNNVNTVFNRFLRLEAEDQLALYNRMGEALQSSGLLN